MCWDAQELGILTTYVGWMLFRREDGGVLHLSRMMAFDDSLGQDGYIIPTTFTVNHLMYWFSRRTQLTELLREKRLVEAVEMSHTELAIPNVDVRSRFSTVMTLAPGTNLQDLTARNARSQDESADNLSIVFHPWERQNFIAQGVWTCQITGGLTGNSTVVKVWDTYKYNDEWDNEWRIYWHLHLLWDLCVPKPIARGRISFMEVIVLERVNVCYVVFA